MAVRSLRFQTVYSRWYDYSTEIRVPLDGGKLVEGLDLLHTIFPVVVSKRPELVFNLKVLCKDDCRIVLPES